MKKTLFILSVFAVAFAACEKVTETYEDPAMQLEVSSSYVVFPSDGGTKTVLVTCNGEWTCTTDASWFSVTALDGAIEISADENTSSTNLSGVITVYGSFETLYFSSGNSGNSDNTVKQISISVTQAMAESGIDLSADGTENCYIASTGTSYSFNALVKGNGRSVDFGGIAAYVDKYGTSIDPDEIVCADLLWEATLDGDKTRSRNVIDGRPVYSNGRVFFTTGTAEGNAVIAVTDASGNILWSWHIWVTDAEIAETEGNGYIWMDRNLGANSTDPYDVANRGLLYQWGRKDPFLPSCAPYGADETEVLNYAVGDGSGEWFYTDYIAKVEAEAPGNIPISIKRPMTVFHAFGSIYSWYLTKSNEDNWLSYLWGDSSDLSTYVKSIFDPCPKGYTVPVQDPWISSKDQDVNYWSVDMEYGRYWTGGNDAYYPCAGAVNGISTVGTMNTGGYGYYWTSGMPSESNYYGNYMYMTPASAISYSSSYPVHTFSVRCMRTE